MSFDLSLCGFIKPDIRFVNLEMENVNSDETNDHEKKVLDDQTLLPDSQKVENTPSESNCWRREIEILLELSSQADFYKELSVYIEELEAGKNGQDSFEDLTLKVEMVTPEEVISAFKKIPLYEKLKLQLAAEKLESEELSPNPVDLASVSEFLSDLPDLNLFSNTNSF